MKKRKFWELTPIIVIISLLILLVIIYQHKTKPYSPEVLNVELINNITQNNDFDCNNINDINMTYNEKNWYYNQCKIIKGE